ncbi:MAG: phosphotransferase [Candidatus Tectomicrobia bacterium]|nr:phosphotransferase [Candidatus Tectomicrobia bacterium]
MFEEALENNDFEGRITQLIQYKTTGFHFDIAVRNGHGLSYIPVDAATDYRLDGRVYFRAEELLKDRQRWNGLWVSDPEVEFAYLLAKKISKQALPEHQKARLQELQTMLGDKAHATARRLFGSRWGNRLMEWLAQSDWIALEAHLPHLKHALQWQTVKRDPLNQLRYWPSELKRMWWRWLYPTGLFIAVLGSDGTGKSTLIQHLQQTIRGSFRGTAVFHLRPRLWGRKASGEPVTEPHANPPYHPLLSVMKLAYYFADYLLGYWLKVRPTLVRSALVLFDRYYDDLLVDSRRYRYGGPRWLLRWIQRLIPHPDLFLIMDAPEDRLLQRKQELPLDELRRQRVDYQRLAAELPNAVLLNGSGAEQEVARQATEVILDFLYKRYLQRRHLWFGKDESLEAAAQRALSSLVHSSEEMHDVTSVAGLSGKGNLRKTTDRFGLIALDDGRGYLVPLVSRRVAAEALTLYNPQKTKARLARKILTIGLKLGLAQPFLNKVSVSVPCNDWQGQLRQAPFLEHLKGVLGREDLTFAISLGTPGPYRKPVLQVLTYEGKTLAYVKVGWNEATNAHAQREAEILERLTTISFTSFVVPRVLFADWWNGHYLLVQSPPASRIEPASQEMTPQYLNILKELVDFHIQWMPLKESDFWKSLLAQIDKTSNAYYRHILQQGLSQVEEQLGDEPLPFYFCHGDFTPWNAKQVNGKLFLFDWEYTDLEAPAGWDLIHFLVRTLWLLKKKSSWEIYGAFQEGEMAHRWLAEHLKSLGMGRNATYPFFLLYLIGQLSLYTLEDSANFRVLHHLAMMINLSIYKHET